MDVGFDFGEDLFGGLGFDEADIALGYGFMWKDGFGAGAAVAAVHAIAGEGGPGRETLKVIAFRGLVETRDAEGLFDFIYVNGQVCEGLAFECGQWLDVVVEAVDSDFAALIFHSGEQVSQGPERVWDDAAPVA